MQALADWQRFAGDIFLPVIAPVLLRGWRSANEGDDAALAACDLELQSRLTSDGAERSIAAGAILLGQTRGAKYQAALGRFRVRVDGGSSPGHLAVAWSAVAALFQIPPLDLLSEYLRQEWIVATQHCPHHEVPQGPLGFSGLAHRALHEAGLMGIAQ
jgi:urease accessory protein UreF